LVDEITPPGRAEYIRNLLLVAGLIDEIDVGLHNLERECSALIGRADPRIRSAITVFWRWRVFAPLALRASRRTTPKPSLVDAKKKVSGAIELCTWLYEHGVEPSEASSANLQSFLSSHPGSITRYKEASKWLVGRTIPGATQSRHASTASGVEAHQVALRALLARDDFSFAVRAALAIMCVTARTATSVLELRRDQVRQPAAGGVELLVGSTWCAFPGPVAGLVAKQMEADDRGPFGAYGSRWLFPSPIPGRHMSAHALSRLLRDLGLSSRDIRRGAIASLASDVPAPALAELSGLTNSWVVHEKARMGEQWSTYPHLRQQ
jgi:hypothetical protein